MSIAKSIVKSNAEVSKSYKRLDSGSWCENENYFGSGYNPCVSVSSGGEYYIPRVTKCPGQK